MLASLPIRWRLRSSTPASFFSSRAAGRLHPLGRTGSQHQCRARRSSTTASDITACSKAASRPMIPHRRLFRRRLPAAQPARTGDVWRNQPRSFRYDRLSDEPARRALARGRRDWLRGRRAAVEPLWLRDARNDRCVGRGWSSSGGVRRAAKRLIPFPEIVPLRHPGAGGAAIGAIVVDGAIGGGAVKDIVRQARAIGEQTCRRGAVARPKTRSASAITFNALQARSCRLPQLEESRGTAAFVARRETRCARVDPRSMATADQRQWGHRGPRGYSRKRRGDRAGGGTGMRRL